MKEYQNIFFDWDGCVYNSLAMWLSACKTGLGHLSVKVDDKDIARHILPELKTATRYGVTDFDTFRHIVLTTASELVHLCQFHIGILEALDQLIAQQITYALVTSSDKIMLEKTLSYHQLIHLFPHRITRDDVSKVKPDPEPLHKAMSLIGAQAETSLMIGDSHVDIKVGQAVGMDTALFFTPDHEFFYSWEVLKESHPTYVFRCWSDLTELIAGQSSKV